MKSNEIITSNENHYLVVVNVNEDLARKKNY